MKKICLILCCCLLLQMVCGCSGNKEEFENPVQFYYCTREISYNSPTGVIQPETREGKGYFDNLSAFLNAYLRGPVSQELVSPIPTDVYLVFCEVENNTAKVVLSSQFSSISGVELSTACSALLLSVHGFTGAETIHISAKESQLDDKEEIVLNIEDVVLIDVAQ